MSSFRVIEKLAYIDGVPPDIDVLAGPLLLGYLFNWGLFGVLCMQVYVYYVSFPKDSRWIKILVYTLFFIDTLQTALTTHNAWHFLAKGWGDPEALIKPGWSWIAVPLISGIVSCTVQMFFSWRIWKLSERWLVSLFISAIAVMQGVCAAICGVWFSIINDVTKISSLTTPATIWLAGSAACDVLIAGFMVYLLRKSATGFEGTDTVINRLTRMTIETGAVTAAAATLELIFYLRWKENNLHMIPALALAKLYTNTLVATLNSRNPMFHSSRGSNVEYSANGNAWGGTSTIGAVAKTSRVSRGAVQIMKTLETHGDVRDRTVNGTQMNIDEESGIAMNDIKIGQLPYSEESTDDTGKEASEGSVKYFGQV
ncbi:uncharacterized protein EI90DRAFT_3069705 [Cantharellus anzutake]|uniref:uncharacterized protein n=1 Tax=Cantharellus anzutake TaxID=1750568 RepID=UPI0019070572|nr:uncharacterized protein EI90DRAFT_3069705 [Cantharellus anzutake]KAF8326565.1 hypothetical protein EI90DRAFT_3069705 [Cantharellus anzutake]